MKAIRVRLKTSTLLNVVSFSGVFKIDYTCVEKKTVIKDKEAE